MLLALMQPNDLKKVFAKMECTEFSKFYRTSKWVYNFLEDTTEDVMIFAHRYIIIYLKKNVLYVAQWVRELDKIRWLVPFLPRASHPQITEKYGYLKTNVGRCYLAASASIANTRNGGSPYENRTIRHNHKICSEAEFAYGLDFPKCKAKFLVDTLAISSSDKGDVPDHLVEKIINCAISQGIKRVRKLELQNRNIKLSRMMLEKLQPQNVRDWNSYRELPDFWNILSEISAKKEGQMVIDFLNSVVELERNCAKVQINSEEPNSEIVPWVANQAKNFHNDNILKGLEMRVAPLGDPEIDRYFPNPTVSFSPPESLFPVHYFVFSALKYSTFVEVRWIQSEEGSLIEVRCRNCENSEEAANFLKDSCKTDGEYFRGSWKQIIDDCFN